MKNTEIIEEIIKIIPVAGEVYKVNLNKKTNKIEIHFYDHFCDMPGGWRKCYEYDFEGQDVEELGKLLVGYSKPVRR